ncbi:MAG TPA: LCCL domain-containing protein [Rhodanobacteraceae bacterium]
MLAMLLPCLALMACSHHDEGPTESQIGKALALKLPDGLKVDDVDIQVAENEGTKVEPSYETRSDIQLEFTDDIYKVTGHLGGKAIVKKLYAKGDDIKGTLITVAEPRGEDAWHIQIKRIDIPDVDGVAANTFPPDGYVEQGSIDYADLKAKVAQQQKQALAQAQKDAQARLQAAQAAAAQSARERAATIAKLSGLMKGTWVAKYPAFHNGSMWASRKNRKLGIEITFKATGDAIGEGTGVLYDFEAPTHQVSAPIGYKIDPAGRFVTLNFTRNLNLLDGVDFSTHTSDQWRMTPDGKLWSSGYGNSWVIQMERNGPALKKFNAEVAAFKHYAAQERALILKYNAANADGYFYQTPLRDHTYGYFFVTGSLDGRVYGDGIYASNSDVEAAAVHAGVLRNGQSGVVRIDRSDTERNVQLRGTTRHGVTSSQGWWSRLYKITLVKALPMPPGQ